MLYNPDNTTNKLDDMLDEYEVAEIFFRHDEDVSILALSGFEEVHKFESELFQLFKVLDFEPDGIMIETVGFYESDKDFRDNEVEAEEWLNLEIIKKFE